MKARLRNNALLVLSIAGYLGALVLVAVLIDLQFYSADKAELLRDRYRSRFGIYEEALNDLAYYYFQVSDPQAREQVLRQLSVAVRKVLGSDEPFVSFELRDAEGELILRIEREDQRRFNTLTNSMIFRDFVAVDRQRFSNQEGEVVGHYDVGFTSPVDFEPLEGLTRRYWMYLGLIWLGITVIYVPVLRLVILPVRNVIQALQGSTHERPRFIESPHTRLERLYNQMARNASLTALRSALTGATGGGLRVTLGDLVGYLAPRIRDWFGFSHVWVLDLQWQGAESLQPVGQLPPAGDDEADAWAVVGSIFTPHVARNLRTSQESTTSRLFRADEGENDERVFLGVLPHEGGEDRLRVLVLHTGGRDGVAAAQNVEEVAKDIYRLVRGLVESQIVQSRELFREKSEANVSLSRNLGHDLTNIIATSKLELMTVGQLLRNANALSGDGASRQGDILRESVTRLLDNTRSLQQVVNLYRAYEYLKSPRYESTAINTLISEVIDLFELAMSTPIEIRFEPEPSLDSIRIEPRLVKLALFNLLVNAQDAIRRLPVEKQNDAGICVQTVWGHGKDTVVVRVRDDGTGIQNARGEPAGEEEIRRIFELGYTTKDTGEGEGLGLNWVRTILTEFHEGELTARNRSEGGAVFEFSLRAQRSTADTGGATHSEVDHDER